MIDENECRAKFYQLLDGYERVPGYSPSQVVSVMTVLDCRAEVAMMLLDELPKYDYVDWSEASWAELWVTFMALQKTVADEFRKTMTDSLIKLRNTL